MQKSILLLVFLLLSTVSSAYPMFRRFACLGQKGKSTLTMHTARKYMIGTDALTIGGIITATVGAVCITLEVP